MNLLVWVTACLLSLSAPIQAQTLPDDAQRRALVERMDRESNRSGKSFGRVDNFCIGKRPMAACVMPGSAFSGGGEGTCRIELDNPREMSPEATLTCVLNARVAIDRKLPYGGYVREAEHCERLQPDACQFAPQAKLRDCGSEFTCRPFAQTPSDRFCVGKAIAESCTVELSNGGAAEKHSGLCKQVVEEKNYYFRGHRKATREVIRCEPLDAVRRTYQ
jgi:hypothetical protein